MNREEFINMAMVMVAPAVYTKYTEDNKNSWVPLNKQYETIAERSKQVAEALFEQAEDIQPYKPMFKYNEKENSKEDSTGND